MDITNIGRYIKSSRKALGLTQSDVAEFLGVSAQAVSKWERGENLPDVALLPDLAKILKISIGELLSPLSPQDNIGLDLEHFNRLSGSQKTELIKTILASEGYELLLDEILPYTGTIHKQAILSHILCRRDYEQLEQMAFYMTNEMKTETLQKLLDEGRFDIIEDIIPIFNRKHRDIIVDFFAVNIVSNILGAVDTGLTQQTGEMAEYMENLMPFFDKKQIERLRESIIEKEEKI